MVRAAKCSECGCIMRCTAWHFEDDVGNVKGTGDFDCRNCDNLSNNQIDGVYKLPGYHSSSLFERLAQDMTFEEFVEEFEYEIEVNI